MNRIELVGRLTAKPELRYTNSNIPFSSFTIAVNRPKQKDKEQETDFIDCRVWRGQAENLANYQDKGSLISVEGSLRKESYQDQEGNKKYVVYVSVDRIGYLESKKARENQDIDLHSQRNDYITEDPFADFGDSVAIDDNFLE